MLYGLEFWRPSVRFHAGHGILMPEARLGGVICIHVHTCACARKTRIYLAHSPDTYMFIYIYIYIHMYTYRHIHLYICMYTHTSIKTILSKQKQSIHVQQGLRNPASVHMICRPVQASDPTSQIFKEPRLRESRLPNKAHRRTVEFWAWDLFVSIQRWAAESRLVRLLLEGPEQNTTCAAPSGHGSILSCRS